MKIPFIDLKTQYRALEDKIQSRMNAVLEHGQFIMGPEIKEFEENLAKFVGCKHVITCGSGTQALTLAMMTAGLKPGDEVITTAFSFFATIDTIMCMGLKPVVVDVDPHTYNIDAKEVEKNVTDKTRAIIPVSLYGQAADLDEINAIASKHNLVVIEDAAQSCGAPYKDRRSGNLSDYATTSFYPAKSLGCYGDGGAVLTNDDNKAQLARELRVHGQESGYYHTNLGINSRMDTLQAAILIPKLERYPWEIEQRQKVAELYTKLLSNADCVLPTIKEDRGSVWAQYTVRVPNRDEFRKKMSDQGVPTAVHYPRTMADQPAYTKFYGEAPGLENARKVAAEVVSLPMFPDMQPDQVEMVVQAIKSSL